MKFLLFSLFICISLTLQGQSLYRIEKVKTLRNYYLIYAAKNDTIYKIVSKKEKVSNCSKIRKSKCYSLKFEEVYSIAGPEVDCFTFDEITEICKEPDINLYIATNLKGLCIVEHLGD